MKVQHLSPRMEKLAQKMILGLTVGLACYLFAYVIMADLGKILAFIPDDSAYYFEIAENVANGNDFSFDGLHRTNGYQPLWQIFLVPVFFLFKGTPEATARLVLALQIILMLGASRIFYRIQAQFLSPSASLVSFVFFFFYVFVQSVSGMESALLVFLTMVLLAMGLDEVTFHTPDWRHQLWFGVVLGLVMLARLDSLFLAGAIELFCVIQWVVVPARRRESLVRFGAIFVGATLVVAPYLLYNQLIFQSLAPISAQLKHGFPHLATNVSPMKIPLRDLAFGMLASGYFIWALFRTRLWISKRTPINKFKLALMVMALGVALHLLDTLLYVKWAIFPWHFISYRVFGVFAIGLVANQALKSFQFARTGFAYWIVVSLLIALVGLKTIQKHNGRTNQWNNAAYETAVWARDHSSEESVFAMKDAGNFGYFSQRRTINLDGLVNNMAYQEALKNGKTKEYLDKNNVDYLIQHAFLDRPDITNGTYESITMEYFSNKYEVFGEKITMNRTSEVFRSKPYPSFGSNTLVIVWRWPSQ